MAMNRADQIAEVLRRRIVTGRLAPGDAVPSTRAIMRDHNVAMATASRVLARLQSDGLIVSTPGRGSVVVASDGGARDELTRDGVVDTAIVIADAESMAAVSMRRLAVALGISTMAVYRYVPSRDDLALAMLDRVLGEIAPPVASGSWRSDLEAAATSLWQVMVRHPWAAGALSMTRPGSMPNAMPLAESMLGALGAAGIEPVQAFTDYLCLVTLIRGVGATLEPEAFDRADTGLTSDEWMDTRIGELRAMAPADRFSAMRRIIDTGYPYHSETLMESGLRTFLDGVAARVGG